MSKRASSGQAGQMPYATRQIPSGNEGAGIALRRGGASHSSASVGASGMTKQQKSAASGPARHNQITFYTEEAPGIKVEPLWVIVSSAVFVGVVVLLHLWGKMQA